ncbi:JmjC domain-containing protein [Kitasatospora sp. NPDC058444]|uniref:JmjC domain-containing protein n=1 Tax=Kitasatospora sp. NPDC058444 TaxID=3346504 RepID=UPI00365D85FE
MSALRRLVGDPDQFLTRWPDRPTVYTVNRDQLAELFDRSAARRIVTDPTMRPFDLGMVRDGAPTPTQPDADHPTDTLVLNGLHLTWPPLQNAARQLGSQLGHPITANVYLTPPASTGYDFHWDTHHVFLAQVEGTKVWKLHPPVFVDPLEQHRWTAVGFTPEELDRVKRDSETIALTAGQTLFIPRGWVHAGSTTEDEHSLHITLGVQLLTLHWVVQQLVGQAANDLDVRAALPPTLGAYPIESVIENARTALRSYLDALDLDKVGPAIQNGRELAVLRAYR